MIDWSVHIFIFIPYSVFEECTFIINCPGLFSKPHFPAPSPCLYQQICISAWGVQGPSVWVSFCPTSHRPATVPSSKPLNLNFCLSWSPWWWGGSPLLIHFLVFFFFPLSSYPVTWSSLLSFQVFDFFCQCLVDVLWELFHLKIYPLRCSPFGKRWAPHPPTLQSWFSLSCPFYNMSVVVWRYQETCTWSQRRGGADCFQGLEWVPLCRISFSSWNGLGDIVKIIFKSLILRPKGYFSGT